jgi:two-component system cell cycle response regulator DivK
LPKRPAVLIVDDFADGREALAEYLASRESFSVFTASSAAEALVLARKHKPGIVLMDLSMPEIDGWQATRQLKTDPRTKDTIVIAVTACVFGADEAKAREAGCEGFLSKPFDVARLAEALEAVLRDGRTALPSIGAASYREVSD